jgi:hypothetical protein
MATLQTEEISRHTAIWYFAYGSNMRSSVMNGRGIVPLAAVTVVVPTHVLTFDIFGIPYSEPSFASIAEVEHVDAADGKYSTMPLTRIGRPPVHGVAYLLSQEDYHRLVITEGGNVGYDVVELRAEVLYEDRSQNTSSPAKRQIVVQTLKAKYPWRPNRAPSARYKVCYNFVLQSVRRWKSSTLYIFKYSAAESILAGSSDEWICGAWTAVHIQRISERDSCVFPT